MDVATPRTRPRGSASRAASSERAETGRQRHLPQGPGTPRPAARAPDRSAKSEGPRRTHEEDDAELLRAGRPSSASPTRPRRERSDGHADEQVAHERRQAKPPREKTRRWSAAARAAAMLTRSVRSCMPTARIAEVSGSSEHAGERLDESTNLVPHPPVMTAERLPRRPRPPPGAVDRRSRREVVSHSRGTRDTARSRCRTPSRRDRTRCRSLPRRASIGVRKVDPASRMTRIARGVDALRSRPGRRRLQAIAVERARPALGHLRAARVPGTDE